MPAAKEPPGRVNPSGMLVTGELAYDVASGEASPWTALNDGVSIPGLPVNEAKSKSKFSIRTRSLRVAALGVVVTQVLIIKLYVCL